MRQTTLCAVPNKTLRVSHLLLAWPSLAEGGRGGALEVAVGMSDSDSHGRGVLRAARAWYGVVFSFAQILLRKLSVGYKLTLRWSRQHFVRGPHGPGPFATTTDLSSRCFPTGTLNSPRAQRPVPHPPLTHFPPNPRILSEQCG